MKTANSVPDMQFEVAGKPATRLGDQVTSPSSNTNTALACWNIRKGRSAPGPNPNEHSHAESKMAWQDFDASVRSWVGHASHGETEGLRKVLFGRTVFIGGADRRASRV